MLKLMVVDDENIVIESIKYIVEKNFDSVVVVETARSGREAIEKAEAVKPDLIFMDIRMPGINGIDAIREIKAVYPQVEFVIISACEQFEYAKEAVNLGAVEYLLKPLKPHEDRRDNQADTAADFCGKSEKENGTGDEGEV